MMKKVVTLLLILCFSQMVYTEVSISNVEVVKDATYEEALRYIEEEEYEKAVEILKEAIVDDEDNASYHSSIGWAYHSLEKTNKAKEHYEKAIELDTEDYIVYFYLSIMSSNFEERVGWLKRAAKRFPRQPVFFESLFIYYEAEAIAESYKGNTEVAIKLLQEYRSVVDHYFKTIESQSEPLSDAVQVINSGIRERVDQSLGLEEMFKKDAEQYKALGEANRLRNTGELQDAIKHYDSALGISDAVDHFVYNNRGKIYQQLGNLDQALADFNSAIEISPKDSVFIRHRAQVYLAKGDEEKAFEGFQSVIDLDPESGKGYVVRGWAYETLGQFDKAILDYSKAIEINDKHVYNAYSNRSRAYRRIDRLEESMVDIKKAIELNPGASVYFTDVGFIYLDQGKFEEAIEAFNKTNLDFHKFANSYFGRYLALKAKGHIEQANDDLKKVRELDIGLAENTVITAKQFEKANRIRQALQYMNYAFEINPELEVKYKDFVDVLKSKLVDSKEGRVE